MRLVQTLRIEYKSKEVRVYIIHVPDEDYYLIIREAVWVSAILGSDNMGVAQHQQDVNSLRNRTVDTNVNDRQPRSPTRRGVHYR